MNKHDLYRAIGQIDDDLIENAASVGKKTTARPWIKWTGLAACFTLVIAAAMMLPKLQNTDKSAPAESVQEALVEEAVSADVTALGSDASVALRNADMGFDVTTLSVTATEYRGSSISTDTDFIITANGITEDMVREYVNIIPSVDYTLSTASNGGIILSPENLTNNSIVNLELTDDEGNPLKKWAFQTADVFTLTGTYPMDGDVIFSDSGIEFTFSTDKVDITTVEAAFSIKPDVDGRFEQRGKTVIFVPDGGFEPGTDYTVTLDGMVTDTNGISIGETAGFTFSVDTSGESLFGWSGGELTSVIPGTVPVLSSPAGYNYTHLPIDVEVYAYDSFDRFADDIWSASSHNGYEVDTDGMTAVMSFEARQISTPGRYSETYTIEFPGALAEGMYVVKYTLETEEGITDTGFGFIQVSPLSVYAAASDDHILVWINDTRTDDVVQGVNIEVSTENQTVTAVTDGKGSAVLELPEHESGRQYLLKAEDDDHLYAAVCYSGYDYSDELAEDYYGYIYTSRELYLPTDTIKVWGYILPRRDVELPKSAEVAFGDPEGASFLERVTVELSDNGSFECELDIADMGWSNLPISVYINNELVCRKFVEVNDYEKPIYIISAETDKEIYFADEISDVSITASASFFDGTPASNVVLEYSAGWDKESEKAKCDENGSTGFDLSYNRGEVSDWRPYTANISINTDELDSVATYTYLNPILFYHDIMLEAEVGESGMEIFSNYINLGDIESEDELYADNYPENIMGAAYDNTVTVTGTERYWQEIPTGSYYDIVYKKNVETYSYELIEKPLGPWEAELKDGKAIIEDIELLDDRSYNFTVTTTDSDGYTVTTDVYHTGSAYGNQAEEEINLHFETDETTYMAHFADGEDVLLEVYNYDQLFESEEGHFITFMQQETFYDTTLREGNSFSVDYDERNLPNVNVLGAYYVDGQVYTITKRQLVFKPEQRGLIVDIITDADMFEPGGEADVTVVVTDSSGNPVSGAAVLISVSDEAAFVIKDQSADFLDSLYSTRDWGYISVYGGMGDMMAEMGGGGPMEYRKEFVDDLNFDSLTTDAEGKAHTTVKLADNLTSWRITSLAANGKNAGDSKVNITTSLPMFVSPVFSDTFITGDDISFGCRTYGTEVDGSDEVFYDAFIENSSGETVVDIITVTCSAGENASFNFGKLETGSYTLYLSAGSGGNTDAVQLPFEVVESAAELWVTREVTADEVNSLEPTKYPVTVTVSNDAYKTYNRVLNTVNYSGNARTDEKAAKNLAAEIMADFTGDENLPDDLPSLDGIKNSYGLLSELDAGSGSAFFSARMAAAVPQYVSRSNLTFEFKNILQISSASAEEVTSSYLGLAAFGQPVLNDIRSFAAENESVLQELDMLRLAYGLAILGDYDGAYDIYNRYVTPKLTTISPDGERELLRCDLGGIEETNVEYTAMALGIASVMNLEETEQLAQYIIYAMHSLSHTEHTEFYPLCELMAYLRHYTPAAGDSEEIEFSYVKNGENVMQTVSQRGMAIVSFGTEYDYSNAEFEVTSGEASVVVSYMAGIQEVSGQKSPSLTVEKHMEPSGKLGEDMTVTITVTADKPGVVYIQDYIPTGFRLADRAAYVDGQTVRFYEDVIGSKTVTYRIKPVVSGSFVVETPVAARVDNGALVTGERSAVEVVK